MGGMEWLKWLKEWSQAISAGIMLLAVFVALGIGVASILHTQSMQKRERRERLLDEIIEWAVDMTKGELLMEFADVKGIQGVRKTRLYLYVTVDKLQFTFRQARTRGLYISRIVSILGTNLQQAVGELRRNLEAHIQALKECMDTIDSPALDSPAQERTLNIAIAAARKTTDSKKLLDKSANKVIEETTKIKIRDFS
jgi:hypothetical protein